MNIRTVGADRLVAYWRPSHESLLGILLGEMIFGGVIALVYENGGIVAAVFLVVGVAFVYLARVGVSIDRTNGRVTRWWGIGWPLFSKTKAMAGHDAVSLTKQEARGNRLEFSDTFPVTMAGGAKPIMAAAPIDYEKARRLARRVGRFLGCPVIDSAKAPAVRIEPDELGLSLRDQVLRSGQDVSWPEPPADMRCTYEVRGSAIRIELPRGGPEVASGICACAAIGIGLMAILCLGSSSGCDLLPEKTPPAGRWITCGVGIVGGLTFIHLAIVGAINQVTLDASPHEFCISRRAFRTEQDVIPADELQELSIKLDEENPRKSERGSLVVRTDTETIELSLWGHRLEEVEWIRAAIVYVVTGRT